jgi:hypothetical protein
MYCVYLTTYSGDKLPPYYIGSTSIAKISNGYKGSVSSLEFKQIWDDEICNHPELFNVKILSEHSIRKDAIIAELNYQIQYDVVKSSEYINKSLAQPDGFFGMDVFGSNNPMYGRNRTGEKHKGGENISAALKVKYASGELDHAKNLSRIRFTENNPMKSTEAIAKAKAKWKETNRNIREKNPMYGKKSPMAGKKLYTDGKITRSFFENEQPEGWVLGRHSHIRD